MENAIYFSKIEYREVVGYGNTASVILLDIPERELSYQVFDCKKQMQAIEERWNKNGCSYDITNPAKKIRNAKTGFEPRMIREEANHQKRSNIMKNMTEFERREADCECPLY